jgi:hypothetical protein
MPHDPDVLRWLAFTDAELNEIEGALGTVAQECSPDPDHPDPLDDLLGQVRAERARRAGTHSAHRTGSRTSPDPTPEPLRAGEPVVVTFTDPDSRATFGPRLDGLVLEHDTVTGTVIVKCGIATIRAERSDVRRRPCVDGERRSR